MAWVLLLHENEVQDKHVESVWFPRLDEGSNPSSSTFCGYIKKIKSNVISLVITISITLYPFIFNPCCLLVIEICLFKCVFATTIKTMGANHILWKSDCINESF